ncbi:uncharacterized protein FA14DRAFT_128303 [Meira miltonrushii]|uniref:Glyoxylate reductase n=1 Tax=Meira miltonrushii TaxID=1280837 RepID=A0A316V1Q5_9BASI|nr:uncharacterized protein FA14DRAFT_128303 [Meira miltonrushii]PWN31402.1 hypothetical protein FA14DRAFT_128303 [Meira miltonrushii]
MSNVPTILLCRDIPSTLLKNAEEKGLIQIIRRSEDGPAPKEWIRSNITNANAIIVTLTEPLSEEMIEAGKKLQVVSTMSVGTDHIDTNAIQKRSIKLGTTPDVLDDAVADLTLLLTLAAMRNLSYASRIVQQGQWSKHPWSPLAFCGPSLRGKTIGFVGFGNIAQTVASLMLMFQPGRILYTTSKPKPFDIQSPDFSRLRERASASSDIEIRNVPDLQQLAKESDVVITLTSLNPSTKHLIDEKFLSSMKRSAYLINTARGPIVDTIALAQALESGQIAGAGLDVLEGEPNISSEHPLLQESCRDRVLILPHIGSATNEARQAMADLCVKHVLDQFSVSL